MPFDSSNYRAGKTRAERAVALLDETQDILRRKGWRKGSLHWPWWLGGGYCLIGALRKAASADDSMDGNVAFFDAVHLIAQAVPHEYRGLYFGPLGLSPIEPFNDHPRTRKRDVLDVLARAKRYANTLTSTTP